MLELWNICWHQNIVFGKQIIRCLIIPCYRSYPCGPGQYSADGIEHGAHLDRNGLSINENVSYSVHHNRI